jgi:hypothetical protein
MPRIDAPPTPDAGSAAAWQLRVGAKLSDAATVDCNGRKTSRTQSWTGKKPAAKKSSEMDQDRRAQFTITEGQEAATDLSGRLTLGNKVITVTQLGMHGRIVGTLTTGTYGTLKESGTGRCRYGPCATATTRVNAADGTLRKYLGSKVVIDYKQKSGKAARDTDGGAAAYDQLTPLGIQIFTK